MTLPRTLKILGRRVTVRSVKELTDAVGEWKAGEYLIEIVRGQEPLDEADTLLHEVMHATLHCQGRENGGEVEEAYVRALATGMLIVLRENPKLTQYLLQDFRA